MCRAGAGDGGEGPGAGGRELLGDRGGEVGAPAALLGVSVLLFISLAAPTA